MMAQSRGRGGSRASMAICLAIVALLADAKEAACAVPPPPKAAHKLPPEPLSLAAVIKSGSAGKNAGTAMPALKVPSADQFGFTRRRSPAPLIHPAASVQPAASSTSDVVLDNTLGSFPQPTGKDFTLTNAQGILKGTNLFFSFSKLSITPTESLTFALSNINPPKATDVFARVTGGSASNIQGQLFCEIPNANLFLINPAGIVVAPSSTISTPANLALTTANYLRFADKSRFAATSPQGAATLSSAAFAAYAFSTSAPAAVAIGDGSGAFTSISSPSGSHLWIVSGPISVNAAAVFASGAEVDLVAVDSAGEAVLTPGNSAGAIDVSAFSKLADISVTNSLISLDQQGIALPVPGSLQIWGNNLTLTNTTITAAAQDQPGNLSSLNLSGTMSMVTSEIAFDTKGTAPAESIQIQAASLQISGTPLSPTQVSGISSSSDAGASGTPGNITVNLSGPLSLSGVGSSGQVGIFSQNQGVSPGTGSINITAGSISLGNEAQISSSGFAAAPAGPIQIDSGALVISGGAQILAETANADAGSITVNATAVTIDGGGGELVRNNAKIQGGIFADTTENSSGRGGDITVNAASLSIADAGVISAVTSGTGNGGGVNVTAATILLNGSGLVPFTGISANTQGTQSSVEGNGGTVDVTATQSLQIVNQAGIAANTFGAGQGGSIHVMTDSLTITGTGNLLSDTDILATTTGTAPGAGSGGSILVMARTLLLQDFGSISATTKGSGAGGTVNVEVTGQANLQTNAAILSDANPSSGSVASSEGNAGSVTLFSPMLQLSGGGRIGTDTSGTGTGGNVQVNITGKLSLDGAGTTISSQSIATGSGGAAGKINITAGSIALTDGSSISSNTAGSGIGGDVNLAVADGLSLTGASIASASLSTGAGGNAGAIIVDAGATALNQGADISSDTQGQGTAGSITLMAPALSLDHGSQIQSLSRGTGSAGSVTLNLTDDFRLLGKSSIDASAPATSGGGDIVVTAGSNLSVNDSTISAQAKSNGRIYLASARTLSVENHSNINSQTVENSADSAIISLDEPVPASISGLETAINAAVMKAKPLPTRFVILDQSQILGQTHPARNGIALDTKVAIPSDVVFISSGDSEILSNNVFLPPETDIAGALLSLPPSAPASDLGLIPVCAPSIKGNFSSFVVISQGGRPPQPSGWLPNLLPATGPDQ